MNQLQDLYEKHCILKVLTGSRLYGTHTENSDYDYRGIALPGEDEIFSLDVVEHVDYEGDYTIFALKKFISLAMDNNPNILELLFVPESNIVHINQYGRELLNLRKYFPYQGLLRGYLGYATSQKHKMYIKKENIKILKNILDLLIQKRNQIELLIEVEHENAINENKYIKIADLNFQKNCKIEKAIKMIENRLSKVSNRTLNGNEFYDTKFAMNLIRLLYECISLLVTGEMIFPFKNERLKILKDIKNGIWTKEEIIDYANELEEIINYYFTITILPKNRNHGIIYMYVKDTMRKWCLEIQK